MTVCILHGVNNDGIIYGSTMHEYAFKIAPV